MAHPFSFDISHIDSRTRARVGIIHTPHGEILTPSFVPVGTQASVKSLSPDDLDTIGVQLYFVNTFHMYLRPGISVVRKIGGLHEFMHWTRPLMTDSGGFQVFSLGRENRPVTILQPDVNERAPSLVRIGDTGVEFRSHWDGSKHLFTPELSMEWQWALGSDIHIAFDDCTPYPVTLNAASVSLGRTHAWAEKSLNAHRALAKKHSTQKYQALYGSVQGSVYEQLRKKSASFIGSMDFDGYAIGGVSVGESKQEMVDVMNWVTPLLPDHKPRHLLGVGEIDDIFALIENGIDTFDCVQPTRLARAGSLYIRDKRKCNTMDITKAVYADDIRPVDRECTCYTCSNFTRAYVHHLFHVRELLAYRLATIHNIFFIQSLVSDIRGSIKEDSFVELKKKWL